MPEIHILPTPEQVSDAAARYVAALAEQVARRRGRFAIALSGGSTPKTLYERLASDPVRSRMPWQAWEVFFGDERCLPPCDEQSNYRMAHQALLNRVSIPEAQVHRVRGESPPAAAALAYEEEIVAVLGSPPAFDLVLLGVGEDGHTASLFPGDPSVEEGQRLVTTSRLDGPGVPRVTFTLRLINAAREVAFLATGAGKAEPVGHILSLPARDSSLPAGRVAPSSGRLHWFLSSDAAARVPGVTA